MTKRMVEMVRDAAESGGRDRFSCTSAAWELLLESGEAFGWRPQGTTYVSRPGSTQLISAKHDYQPGGPTDQKQLTSEDAIAWAKALDEARRSPHFAAMLAKRSGRDPAAIDDTPAEQTHGHSAACAEFIEYAYGGAFAFAASAD
jgi:hypothetical protein